MQKSYYGMALLLIPFVLVTALLFVTATRRISTSRVVEVARGDSALGEQAIRDYGCGSCHVIPGIAEADGQVGPSLAGIVNRSFIAGRLQNTPDNMIVWIMHPQLVDPGVDMPELGVTENAARNITAYLYTLR